MKDTFYFSHDYYSRQDPKLVALLMKYGYEGIGLYWCIVENLYEQNGYLLLSECDSLAFALHADAKRLKSIILDTNLFENDGVKYWSNTALERLHKRDEKSRKAQESALKRWKKDEIQEIDSERNADAMPTHSDSNAIKERKGKENKINKGKEIKESPLHPLQKFIKENLPNVSKLKTQMSPEQCETILSKYAKEAVKKTLLAMENKADLSKKYNSVYLTLNNWLSRDNAPAPANGKSGSKFKTVMSPEQLAYAQELLREEQQNAN